jgi:hypothetical protein
LGLALSILGAAGAVVLTALVAAPVVRPPELGSPIPNLFERTVLLAPRRS